MSSLTTIDKARLELLLDMGGGYVLQFSNSLFADFFRNELGIDIYSLKYEIFGTSKAKRMRAFWQLETDKKVAKVLWTIFSNWEVFVDGKEVPESVFDIIYRLDASLKPKPQKKEVELPAEKELADLKKKFLEIESLEPQLRGYALEQFLTSLFNLYNLKPRSPFRVIGEQIDGSFELESQLYLVEAKWTKGPIGVESLYAFHAKVTSKSSWTRGLFISMSGFTDVGIESFSRGNVTSLIGFDVAILSLTKQFSLRSGNCVRTHMFGYCL